MHTLHLMEFAGYDSKDIYTYLLTNNENSFRIILKRDFQRPQHEILEVANEYFNAIYFGQKLSELTLDFSYSVPSEYSALPFIFEFTTTNMEQLADTLYYLIRGIVPDPDTVDLMKKYHRDKENFLKEYLTDKIYPACHGLIYKMDKLLRF